MVELGEEVYVGVEADAYAVDLRFVRGWGSGCCGGRTNRIGSFVFEVWGRCQ